MDLIDRQTFNAGNSTFSIGEAGDARGNIIDDDFWIITDGGVAPMDLEFNTTHGAGTQITLPLSGTVHVTIDWGDGSTIETVTSEGDKSHTYASEGTYNVSISGILSQYGNGVYYANAEKLTKVTSFGGIGLTSLNGAFYGTTNLRKVPETLPSSITNLSNAFYNTGKASITGLDSWDVSNVTDMSYMFSNASVFDQDIGTWNVSNVTDMNNMFNASAFNQNIGSWTVSNVTNMAGMFYDASVFNQNIANWDVSMVTDMNNMFNGAAAFDQNIGSWIVSSVTDMSKMFWGAATFNQDIGSWIVGSVSNMSYMFGSTQGFNQDIGSWDVSSVTNMSYMFFAAGAFNQDIGNWDVSNVTDMSNMFRSASAFNQDISNWDVSNVTDMRNMFSVAYAFNQNIGSWDVSNVTRFFGMFGEATLSIANYDALLIGWAALDLHNGLSFNGGTSKYSSGAAATARASIETDNGWTIHDGGLATDITWDGFPSSDWNNADNWNTNTVPTSNENVIVPDVSKAPSPVIATDGTASCANLTINSGASLTIQSSATGTGSLIVEGTSTGDVIFKRYVDEASKAATWHYVSAPIAGQAINNSFMTNNSIYSPDGGTNYNFYRWDEDTDYWIAYGSTGDPEAFGDSDFADARGYAITRSAAGEISFTGTVRTNDVSYAATYTAGKAEGYNLVGNPFSSAIGITNAATSNQNFISTNTALLNDNYEAVFLWDEQAGYDRSQNDYKVISNAAIAGYTQISQDYIQPGQAFMVRVVPEGGNLAFNKNMQAHATVDYFKDSKETWPSVELIAKNAELFNATAIGFNEYMSPGIDPSYDVGKMKGNPDIALYTRLVEDNGVDFAIQALPFEGIEEFEIPVGIDVLESGVLEFSINHDKLENYDIMLEDRQEGIFTNLRRESYFAEISESGTGRFYLHFKDATAIGETIPQSNVSFRYAQGRITLNNPDHEVGRVLLTNITGQTVKTIELNADKVQGFELRQQTGIYILSIQTNKGVLSKKIFIN